MAKAINREKILAALVSSNTIKDAAEVAGLSERTLYRYLADSEFLAEFRARSKALYDASSARILKATERAVYVLKRNLDCSNPAVETRSASVILEHAAKRIETDEILARLEALEANDAGRKD